MKVMGMKSATKLFSLLLVALLLTACGKAKEPEYTKVYQSAHYIACGLEFDEISRKEDPSLDISLTELYLDPDTLSYGYVLVTVLSQEDASFTLVLESKHPDGSVLAGDSSPIELVAGEPQTVDMFFTAWPDPGYDLILHTEGLKTEQAILIHMYA